MYVKVFWLTLWLVFGISTAEAQVKQKFPAGLAN